MPKGIYQRSEKQLAEATARIKAVRPPTGFGVRGNTPEKHKEKVRRGVRKYNATVKGLYGCFKNACYRRGETVVISLEEFEDLRKNICFYCGGELPVLGHGLDRLDNTEKYAPYNVVPCCKKCNRRKGRLEQMGFRYPRTVELMIELVGSKE